MGDGSAQDVLSVGSSIYVGGSFRTWASGDTTGRWKVEKRNAVTGALDTKFGGESAALGTVVRLAADQESLYVAGGEFLGVHPDGQPDYAWRVEKRKLRSGALDRRFGHNGVLALNFSPFSDWCRGLIVDGPDLYLIGDDSIHQDPQGTIALQWRIEKRSASTRAARPRFRHRGSHHDLRGALARERLCRQPYDALLLDGSLVIVGSENGHWRIEKRNRINEALDADFGPGGVVIRDPAVNFDEARRIVSDGTFLYVAGTQEGFDGSGMENRKVPGGHRGDRAVLRHQRGRRRPADGLELDAPRDGGGRRCPLRRRHACL